MSNAILIHGWASKGEFYDLKYPTASNSHWFPWLTKQLMVKNIHTVALEMPNGYYPEYNVWKKELERFEVNEETILVGHSCGAGFIVRWLSENDVTVAKVILVAPWLGTDPDNDFDKTFFDFQIDPKLTSRAKDVLIIHSSNDGASVQNDVKTLRAVIPDIRFVELQNKGHFTLRSLGTEAFPELLEEIMR